MKSNKLPEMFSCPFCGFKPDSSDPDIVYPINRERTIWQAGCATIYGGCDATILGDSPEDAIANWNRRTIR